MGAALGDRVATSQSTGPRTCEPRPGLQSTGLPGNGEHAQTVFNGTMMNLGDDRPGGALGRGDALSGVSECEIRTKF